MLAEDVEPELIGPPVTVLDVVSACCMHFACLCDGGVHTLVPPDAVLATRMGHFAGSSPILPIVIAMGCDVCGIGKQEGNTGSFLREERREAISGHTIAELQWRMANQLAADLYTGPCTGGAPVGGGYSGVERAGEAGPIGKKTAKQRFA